MQPVTLNLIFSSFQKDPASRRVLIVIAVFFTVLLLFCLRICPPGHSRRFLSVVSQEKQRYGSGAGMGADGRAYIINNAAFNSKPFPYQVTYVFRILLGIAVADEKAVVFVPVAANSLFHHIHQAVQGFLLPRTLPTAMRWPSLSTWRRGLMLASVPTMAVALLTLPPR